jgi:hypothetical protein
VASAYVKLIAGDEQPQGEAKGTAAASAAR